MTTLTPDAIAADAEAWLEDRRLDGVSDNTLRSYASDIRSFTVWLNDTSDDPTTLDQAARLYINDIRDTMSGSTVKRRMAALRMFGRWKGMTLLEGYRGPQRAEAEPTPLPNGRDDVTHMLNMARVRNTPHARLIIALQGTMGLRISETRRVTAKDIDWQERLLTVHGKGDKQRYVPISAEAMIPLKNASRVALGGPLVPVSDRRARTIVKGIAARCGIDAASHDLRATAANGWLHDGVDIRTVQELLGHANVATTQLYTLTSMTHKRAAIEGKPPSI